MRVTPNTKSITNCFLFLRILSTNCLPYFSLLITWTDSANIMACYQKHTNDNMKLKLFETPDAALQEITFCIFWAFVWNFLLVSHILQTVCANKFQSTEIKCSGFLRNEFCHLSSNRLRQVDRQSSFKTYTTECQ